MTRFYLTYAIMFLVPFALYVSYIYFSMGRTAIRGADQLYRLFR